VVIGIVLFILSSMSALLLPTTLVPVQDTARSLLAIELPSGAQLSETQRITDNIAEN